MGKIRFTKNKVMSYILTMKLNDEV